MRDPEPTSTPTPATTLRAFAHRVVTTRDLGEKLASASAALPDTAPGPALRLEAPGRPPGLEIRPGRKVKVPSISGMSDPAQRARILHALANHELQAAELFAWALLAFPAAQPDFRQGLARILDDEQRHTRMYIARLESCGQRFGDFPVSGYFWNKTPDIQTPLAFVCAMSLTFENANLDHTAAYAEAARQVGDVKTAKAIESIGRDEEDHVRFGWTWLERWKEPGVDPWAAWLDQLSWPLRPARAKGSNFQVEPRRRAGLDESFIDKLRSAEVPIEGPNNSRRDSSRGTPTKTEPKGDELPDGREMPQESPPPKASAGQPGPKPLEVDEP